MSTRIKMLTHKRLLELLDYDPKTGEFTFKIDISPKRRAGMVAGRTYVGNYRYLYREVYIDGVAIQAGRLVWFYITGEWPVFEIDHIDTNRLNNRWNNLRQATRHQNEINKSAYRNNTTGLKGVYRKGKSGKFRAAIQRGRRRVHLGSFDTPEAAHSAYVKAATSLDGEFLRTA